ncbi:hypothetical protein CCR75_001657 [Bremia lactucae]|uniref:Glucosidase 2 subunit beta n=1 Tax=Bremia lactucae TaxID=4779 RepID=A0A976FP09_BRELC|nr:hypothetical protein CCR75_001657 [Bremia lactucae]
MSIQRLGSLLTLFLTCACASDWLGISPELQQKLTSVSSFVCDHGHQRLDFSRLNDNYCDCADGSDEPGTSACSHTPAVFHCVNAGFFSVDIPTSQVNDGICDCCDGSDEYANVASCASACVLKMEAFKADKKGEIEQLEAGLKDRVALVAESQRLWNEELEKTQQLETLIASLKMALEDMETKKTEDERLEKEEKDKRVAARKNDIYSQLGLLDLTKEQLLSIILEIGRHGVSTKDDLLSIIRKEREAAQEEEVPTTVFEEKVEAFRERDETRQIETRRIETLMEEREKAKTAAKATDEETSVSAEVGGDTDDESVNDENELILPEVESHPVDLLYQDLEASERFEWVRAVLARTEHGKATAKLREEESKLSAIEKVVEKNYGVDQVFFALRDKCVENKAGQYKYKICFYGRATQDSIQLGSMQDIVAIEEAEGDDNIAASVQEILFVDGQACWNGPKRSLTVKLQCGPEPMELFEIEEPSTCVYAAKLRTPAVCRTEDREKIMTYANAEVAPHHIEIEVLPIL